MENYGEQGMERGKRPDKSLQVSEINRFPILDSLFLIFHSPLLQRLPEALQAPMLDT